MVESTIKKRLKKEIKGDGGMMLKPCKICEKLFRPVGKFGKICNECKVELYRQGLEKRAKKYRKGYKKGGTRRCQK